MNINIALLLFSFIILLYWVIAEMFTFFFRLTGLTAERARFQVISLLTGTGFTTGESEIVMSTQRRRRLARVTMLFGFVFNITIVSAFINVFISMKVFEVDNYIVGFLIPLGVIALMFIFMRVPSIHTWEDKLLRSFTDKVFFGNGTYNAVMLVDNIGGGSICQVSLRNIPEEFQNRTLAETGLRADTGILVMLVERKGLEAEPARADTVFASGDKLTVFGNYKSIRKAFHAREHFLDE